MFNILILPSFILDVRFKISGGNFCEMCCISLCTHIQIYTSTAYSICKTFIHEILLLLLLILWQNNDVSVLLNKVIK